MKNTNFYNKKKLYVPIYIDLKICLFTYIYAVSLKYIFIKHINKYPERIPFILLTFILRNRIGVGGRGHIFTFYFEFFLK